MVDNSNVDVHSGGKAADTGRMAEAEAVAKLVYDCVVNKWLDVLAGEKSRYSRCGFCVLCDIADADCVECPSTAPFRPAVLCDDVTGGLRDREVLDILEKNKDALLEATRLHSGL